MALDCYIVSKVGNNLYEVRRYKSKSLLESILVDLSKDPKSQFEAKRMYMARRYASELCPKGAAYWFAPDGSISRTTLDERATRKHFLAAASAIRALRDPQKRQDMANYQANVFSSESPHFDHSKFHKASGTQPTA